MTLDPPKSDASPMDTNLSLPIPMPCSTRQRTKSGTGSHRATVLKEAITAIVPPNLSLFAVARLRGSSEQVCLL